MTFLSKLSRKKRKKGFALIATLFTVIVVFTLGSLVIAGYISQSRETRAKKQEIMASRLAKAGAELVLNYMSCNHENFGDSSSKEIWVVEDQNTGLPYKLEEYTDTGDPVILRQGNGIAEELKFNITRTWDDTNKLYSYDITILPDRVLTADGQYTGNIKVRLIQARFVPAGEPVGQSGQPHQYIIESIGRVFRSGDSTPVAQKKIEVRFREKSALDNLMFMQNHRAYDMVGNGVPPPNANDGTNNMAGIPKNLKANGSIVIDGNSNFASETAGNFQFFDIDGVEFLGSVSINQSTNLYPGGTTQADIDDMFKGGLLTDQPSMGLPRKDSYMSNDDNGDGSITLAETGNAIRLAQDDSGTHPNGDSFVKAYYVCGNNDGFSTPSGIIGHNTASDPSIWTGSYGVDTSNPYEDMSTNIPADIEFDGSGTKRAPGFATYIVELTDDSGVGRLTLKKKTAFTNQTVTLLNNVKLTQFKNGLLYIEGGNIDIKGQCNGKITIVTGEHPTREAYAYDVKVEGLASPVRQYSTIRKNMDVYPSNPEYWVPGKISNGKVEWVKPVYSKETSFNPGSDSNSEHIYLPYDSSQLPVQIDPATGTVTGSFHREGPFKVGGRWVWPSSDLIRNTVTNVTDGSQWTGMYRDTEREGNAIIGDDITYTDAPSNALGIIAKNYILLNADDVIASGHTLDVRAVLMSFDHSVQFDDVNLANKTTWLSQPNMDGTFNFTGSIISQYADVEGKTDGTGYTIQNLLWDSNLQNAMPPHFPHWDMTQMDDETIMEFVILSYQESGALKTN